MLNIYVYNVVTISAQYGETDYIYQYVDELQNHDDWGFNSSINHNATLDCLELSYSGVGTENFSLYTEVDGDGDLTVNSSHIEWSSMRRDADDYVYYDFGVDFFHDLTWDFVIKIDDIEAGDVTGADIGGFACLTTIAGSVVDSGADDNIMVRLRQESNRDDLFRWYLLQRHNGATKVSIIQPLNTDNSMGTYYCTLYRLGTNLTFYAYTDSARTILDAKLTSNGADDDDSYRYSVAVASIESGSDPADHSSGFFFHESFSTSAGYESSGYIFRDRVIGAGNVSLVDLLNATIPSGDSITVQYSPNNVTWSSPFTLVNGHNAIELRDLNYTNPYSLVNMTNTGADSTPRLLQFRDIYWSLSAPSGAGAGVTTIRYEYVGIPLAIILFIMAYFFFERR